MRAGSKGLQFHVGLCLVAESCFWIFSHKRILMINKVRGITDVFQRSCLILMIFVQALLYEIE